MKRFTFIHCADLHLDSPMAGLKYLPDEILHRLQESTFKALSNLVDSAIKHQVDCIVIAGDVFDGESRSLRGQARFRKEMNRLKEAGIPAFVIHGNHDHLGAEWLKLEMPENVHQFGSKVEKKRLVTKSGATVHLYGFSYPQRHVPERWIDQYSREEGADFHVGILHGHSEGNSEHGVYAPFHLTDLLEKDYDYWALGHIHKRQVLSADPPVIYSGNTQGRNVKETGPKGGYLVTLTEGKPVFEFLDFHDVIWEECVIDASEAGNAEGLYDLCRRKAAEARTEGKGTVLTLRMENLGNLGDQAFDLVKSGELIELLQEDELEQESFVWVRDLAASGDWTVSRLQLEKQGDFYKELFSQIDGFDGWDEALDPLFRHSSAKRYLDKLETEEKEQLLREAEIQLLRLLAGE